MATAERRRQRRTVEPSARETIINFNQGEREASVFTYERTWQQHLEKRLGLKPVMDNGYGGKEYHLDKSRIRLPQPKRQYSEAARKAMTARLAKVRGKQLALTQS